jgi:hypothetical protein
VFASAAVRLVANAATLLEDGRMQNLLGLMDLCHIGMAAFAGGHRARLHKFRVFAGVGIMALRAVALRAWVRHLGRIDSLCFVVVARHAKGSGIALCQYDFAVLRSLMARVTGLFGEG